MNNRDFKFWLHGWMEIGSQRKFTPTQVEVVRDHICEVENNETPDDFVLWLKGAIDTAIVMKCQRTEKFYSLVEETLNLFFEKHTPNRKEELSEDSYNLKKMISDLEKGVSPKRIITPLVVGPPQPYQIGGDTARKPDVFCTEVTCRSIE